MQIMHDSSQKLAPALDRSSGRLSYEKGRKNPEFLRFFSTFFAEFCQFFFISFHFLENFCIIFHFFSQGEAHVAG